MNVSVIICTWNRANLLRNTLDTMKYLSIPDGVIWELVVVNNNCTDDTDQVLDAYNTVLPLRRLFEPKPGHTHARNCAIGSAEGELLIWTDDDVLVDPNWLAAYVRAAQSNPEAAYFGGRIEPIYACEPPKWLTANIHLFQGMLVIRDLGSAERRFEPNEFPFGANMAIRADIQRRFLFRTDLGRVGQDCIVGDETNLFSTLEKQGVAGVWVPSARVRHFTPRERLTSRYVWQYCRGNGQTRVRSGDKVIATGPAWQGVPRWMYRRRWELLATAYWQRLFQNDKWIAAYSAAAAIEGEMRELRIQRHTTNSAAACSKQVP